MAETQTYTTHRRWFPLFHFVASPILIGNLLVQLFWLYRRPGIWSLWNAIVAIGLVALLFSARVMALRVQDRLIRLEQRLRLQTILPGDLRSRVGELRARHLVALRFASDEEAPELIRAVLNGELKTSDEIKRRIKVWQPDTLRA